MPHYNPRDFFRRAPNYLLEKYFADRGVFDDFDWVHTGEKDEEVIYSTFLQIDDDLQDQMSQDFRELIDRSQAGFIKAILDEAAFHNIDDDLPLRFDGMRSHLERVFWTFLHRKDPYWQGASIFWHIDKLPTGQWQKRRKLPARPGPVDEGTVENLTLALINYYGPQEARGRKCIVESYRRGQEEIFYAYPEDYRQTFSRFSGNNLHDQTIQPVFELIFRHNDAKRTLDVHSGADRTTVSKLQVLFAQSVLNEEIDEDSDDDHLIYDLQPLLSASFAFSFPDELDIDFVEIRTMRIVIEGEPWRRLTLECDPSHDHDAIYDLLDKVSLGLNKDRFRLDQVKLKVSFVKKPSEKRKPVRTVLLTRPHTSRLTQDFYGQQIQGMLVHSGIEKESEDSAEIG